MKLFVEVRCVDGPVVGAFGFGPLCVRRLQCIINVHRVDHYTSVFVVIDVP